MLEKLNADTFEPLSGQAFKMQHEDMPDGAEAKLVEVRQVTEDECGPSGRPAFSLLFACPNVDQPFQAMFKLDHESTGELDLFLVPVGQDERGLLMEAVFT